MYQYQLSIYSVFLEELGVIAWVAWLLPGGQNPKDILTLLSLEILQWASYTELSVPKAFRLFCREIL